MDRPKTVPHITSDCNQTHNNSSQNTMITLLLNNNAMNIGDNNDYSSVHAPETKKSQGKNSIRDSSRETESIQWSKMWSERQQAYMRPGRKLRKGYVSRIMETSVIMYRIMSE